MTEERKKNNCVICFTDGISLGYYCGGEGDCDFNPSGQCIHKKCADLCRSTEAKSDALNRASAAINEEQARRANEAQSTA